MAENGVLDKIVSFVTSLKKKEEGFDKTGFLLVKDKESDRLRFVVRYSNNFRDDDQPISEIISENSHRRFDEMVDKGILPMPELWLWHVPEWKFGVADWHAYDDSGFAMASGLVDEGKEHIALWVSKQQGVRTSHGMPPVSIIRDPEDPSVIIEHQTVEISPLPGDRAANKMTGFYILGNESKEAGMGIPTDKLKQLIQKWDASEELLLSLEVTNAQDAEVAKASGVESKEAGAPESQPETVAQPEVEIEVETEKVETTEPTKEDATVEEEPQAGDADIANKATDESQLDLTTNSDSREATGDSPKREEIAEAIVDAVRPIIEENRKLTEEVAQLRKEVTHLTKSDEEKIEKAIGDTPPASVSALIAAAYSVTRSKETEIDGRTSLAKSKPKEAEEVMDITGVPFLDNMLNRPAL